MKKQKTFIKASTSAYLPVLGEGRIGQRGKEKKKEGAS